MTEPARPRRRTLARAWFDVGTQSVGGGSSTPLTIRRVRGKLDPALLVVLGVVAGSLFVTLGL